MVLKTGFTVLVSAVFLASAGMAAADQYSPEQFLRLDLPSALLSPKRLGPSNTFAPVPVEAADRSGEGAQARAERLAEPKVVVHKTRVVHVRAEHPRGSARVKLARRHGNPLDAQAFDTRIQVWPCRSGGICNWKR